MIEEHGEELIDIENTLPNFIHAYNNRSKNSFVSAREIWDKQLVEIGWSKNDSAYYSDYGQRIFFGNLGPIKNDVAAHLSFGHIDFLNRWLFQQTALAAKYHVAQIPVLLVPTEEYSKRLDDRGFSRLTLELCFRQIQPLTPLTHTHPFLILGYTDSDQEGLFGPEIIELEVETTFDEENIIIDKSIEFPSEYYQAGLNILNYFGTYLREQYPNEEAKVKIEQYGNTVRLIIENSSGEKEIIEKALEEYQLVVSGQRQPAEITSNQKLILELNSELRIAKYRIETQQDIIQVQKGQIENLFTMIANGLAAKNSINIEVNPVITLNQNNVNQSITNALSSLNELKELLPSISPEYIEIQELEDSLISIEKEENPEAVKNSSAMKKFKELFDSVEEGTSNTSKVIKTVEGGVDMLMNLAGKYNKIAEWCGLPQVPSIFTN